MTGGRFSTTPFSTFISALDSAIWLFYPSRCLLCGEPAPDSLCPACADSLVAPLAEPVCPICGHSRLTLPCTACASNPPRFVAARAAGPFGDDLQHMIHLLKYRDRPQLAVPLGKRLAQYARDMRQSLADLDVDFVAAVPMRKERLRRRGYNQSDRLARVLAEELNLPYERDALVRTRRVRPQMQLKREQRLVNLIGVFAVGRCDVTGKCILLIDDVSTTGATFRECAAVLREGGAKGVWCLALAAG